jgi:ABC-type uncharacterized transport system involved in gliding motility auxiliary subunit
MRRVVPFLAPAGVVLALAAWTWHATQRPLPGGLGPWLAGALVLVVLHLILRWEDATRLAGTRHVKYGANSVLFSLVFLTILGVGNYFVQKNTKRWDLTKNQRYSLSPQTIKLLAALREDVTITYFQTKEELVGARDTMRSYELASPHVKLEFVDPRQNAQKARDLEVRPPLPALVIQRGTRQERINSDREQDLANAFVKLTREGKKTVCFVEGEGEAGLDDAGEHGMQSAKQALEQKQYGTKAIVLLREAKVPADCAVVVVAGPQKDLLPESIGGLRDYVRGGGKLLALLEPEFKDPQPNLTALFAEWNLVVGKDLVLDLLAEYKLQGRGSVETLVTRLSPTEEATSDLKGFHPILNGARSVEPGTAATPGVSARKLAWVDQSAWKQTDLSQQALSSLKPELFQDKLASVSVAAVATIEGPKPSPGPSPAASPAPDAPKPPEGRVIVFGDSDFASNAWLALPGNGDLFANSVAWLAQDSDLISIQPRDPDDQRFILTQGQTILMTLFALVGLPGFFIVLGIATWWRRRG